MKVDKETRGGRALVLGGGGATGNAWLIGVIAGLFDSGVDVTQADLVIGTSAGATAAAQVTCTNPTELFASIISAPVPQTAPAGSQHITNQAKPARNHLETTGAIIAAAEDAADMRRKMGAWVLSKEYSSVQWRATVAARLPCKNWPKLPLLISAVNAHTGEPVVFDRTSRIDLVDAVAASCAGGFAYSIGDNQYFDGGYRADVNADLATGYKHVLVIAPLGDKTRKQLKWGLHLTAQVGELRESGSNVETIFPDSDSINALGTGMNLTDLSARGPSAQAGYRQSHSRKA